MVQLAIRCHPCAPGSLDELERWLERHVDELRAAAPRTSFQPLLHDEQLADSARDMRLLGVEPTLLTPHERWTARRAA